MAGGAACLAFGFWGRLVLLRANHAEPCSEASQEEAQRYRSLGPLSTWIVGSSSQLYADALERP